jgi:uncharacterized Zn finger protein (UPF0148 family)
MDCRSCGAPLWQPKTGRRRVYCSRRCKRREERKRAALVANSGADLAVSEPVSTVVEPVSATEAASPRVSPPRLDAWAYGRAVAAVKAAEERLRQARAARKALDPPA